MRAERFGVLLSLVVIPSSSVVSSLVAGPSHLRLHQFTPSLRSHHRVLRFTSRYCRTAPISKAGDALDAPFKPDALERQRGGLRRVYYLDRRSSLPLFSRSLADLPRGRHPRARRFHTTVT